MSAVYLYQTVIYHQNEIRVSREKHDKKDTTIACVSKLPFFRKSFSSNAFLDQIWLGINFWAALNVLLVPS